MTVAEPERAVALRRLRARAVLPVPLRLLRLRHLHRPGPPDGGVRVGLRDRAGPRRRAGGDAAGHLGLLRRRHAVETAGRPAGLDPRRGAPPSRRRGDRRVQPRGRRAASPRGLPGRRGHPGLARRPVDGAPRARGPRSPARNPGDRPGGRRGGLGRILVVEPRPHHRRRRRAGRGLGRAASARCSACPIRRPT